MRGIASLACSVLFAGLAMMTAVRAQVHDVPGLKQSGPSDCGPTAAASCLGWSKNNAYPAIKTRDNKTTLGVLAWTTRAHGQGDRGD